MMGTNITPEGGYEGISVACRRRIMEEAERECVVVMPPCSASGKLNRDLKARGVFSGVLTSLKMVQKNLK